MGENGGGEQRAREQLRNPDQRGVERLGSAVDEDALDDEEDDSIEERTDERPACAEPDLGPDIVHLPSRYTSPDMLDETGEIERSDQQKQDTEEDVRSGMIGPRGTKNGIGDRDRKDRREGQEDVEEKMFPELPPAFDIGPLRKEEDASPQNDVAISDVFLPSPEKEIEARDGDAKPEEREADEGKGSIAKGKVTGDDRDDDGPKHEDGATRRLAAIEDEIPDVLERCSRIRSRHLRPAEEILDRNAEIAGHLIEHRGIRFVSASLPVGDGAVGNGESISKFPLG